MTAKAGAWRRWGNSIRCAWPVNTIKKRKFYVTAMKAAAPGG